MSRAIGVFVLLAAWLALSNHCAFAVMGEKADGTEAAEVHKCCPAKTKSGNETPQETRGICCKTLRVLPTDGAAKLVKAPDWTPLPSWVWQPVAEPLTPVESAEVKRTTGPPAGQAFTELVLHRSLRSHAPPFTV